MTVWVCDARFSIWVWVILLQVLTGSVWVPHATFHLLGFGFGQGPDTGNTEAVLAEKELALDGEDADVRLGSMLENQSDSRLPGRIGVRGKAGAGDFRLGMASAN